MNAIYDLMLWYVIAIAISPIVVISCVNVVMAQIGVQKEGEVLTKLKYKIDLNGKSYFCILILVVVGFIV